MSRSNGFLEAVKAAGLEEELEKICGIAAETIGCDLKEVVDSLKPVWTAAYQDGRLLKQGKFWAVENPNYSLGDSWATKNLFKSEDEARSAVQKLIRSRTKGPRVDTIACGGIGVDIVVDEASAKDEEVVHWRIKKQFRSKWKLEDER